MGRVPESVPENYTVPCGGSADAQSSSCWGGHSMEVCLFCRVLVGYFVVEASLFLVLLEQDELVW